MIHRIDVRPRQETLEDRELSRGAKLLGHDVGAIRAGRAFLIDGELDAPALARAATLLADPIGETSEPDAHATRIEVHIKAGVMDPVAASSERALRDAGLSVRAVRTARTYRLERPAAAEALKQLATRMLANSVIENVHLDRHVPAQFSVARLHDGELRRIALLALDDHGLTKLSRDGHLFLSLAEMSAVQTHFRSLGREPTDIELETIAQTWSEHCVHKTLKSAVSVVDATGREVRRYGNLIKETIFAATQHLMAERNDGFCLSVFKDNAGVIAFDDTDAVCFKVETHNHPSAIEPYGGAATGIGGCIRDILGTGLGAKPIANTDVFCVAPPDTKDAALPPGVIHPKRTLERVVAGVRDYGNRMGIATVNGAVYFDKSYLANPLVFAGCVGIIPKDKIEKQTRDGDAIVVMGGRTGRDGIHGATFSSAELTDTHAEEFSHAVQIGNAITQKTLMDVLLRARDEGLYSAVTDCGAGGLSSAIGEMGADVGATVRLDAVPLKYDGLRYDEIWISEAQERMVLSVPTQHVARLLELSDGEDVESTVIGTFGTPSNELILKHRELEVGRLSMAFLHDGIPMPSRTARVETAVAVVAPGREFAPEHLLQALAHPNIASKHWIVRQYDHEVQGGTIIKPLAGPLQIGPSDAAVLRPKPTSGKGVVIACGLAPWIDDSYEMALAAIDEAIRNAVCCGATLGRLAMLDNFCWPSVADDVTMGTLVRACEACRDAALAYGVPFISGKDSLHNQFTVKETGRVIRIRPTLLISTIGVIDDIRRVCTMDLKTTDGSLYRVSAKDSSLAARRATHESMSELIGHGQVSSSHDISDGGWLVAAAEMAIASGKGLALRCLPRELTTLLEPVVSSYLIEIPRDRFVAASERFENSKVRFDAIGTVTNEPTVTLVAGETMAGQWSVESLKAAWRGTLDW